MPTKKPYRPADLLRDHARSRHAPAPTTAAIEERLTELIAPATYRLSAYYHRLGLRERVLTLPVMVSLLTALVWRQIPSVRLLARLLEREQVLWTPPLHVSQQALNVRIRSLPPVLFQEVLNQVLPALATRAQARHRPRPPVLERALQQVSGVWAVDATTLEALFKKVGLLEGIPGTVLAGKLLGVLDVVTKLPVHLVWDDDAAGNERGLLDRLLPTIPRGTLLLLDRGFFSFPLFDRLTSEGISFVMPDRTNTACTRLRLLLEREGVCDEVIKVGMYRSDPCVHPLRRITLSVAGKQYRYLTNVLDPGVLSTAEVVDLYRQRWRIEEAFLLTKRLLDLSYLWTGSVNGIQLQIWTTWLLYAILVDLSDAVAEALTLPLDRISLEMVYRSLYFVVGAISRGEATDPVAYLAHPNQRDLGLVKRSRSPTALDTALQALS